MAVWVQAECDGELTRPPTHAVKKQVTICDSAMQAALGAEGIVVATGASFSSSFTASPVADDTSHAQNGTSLRLWTGKPCTRAWPSLRASPFSLPPLSLPRMTDPLRDSYSFVFDGRGILDADKLKAIGFKVFTIGRGEEI